MGVETWSDQALLIRWKGLDYSIDSLYRTVYLTLVFKALKERSKKGVQFAANKDVLSA